MNSIRFLYAALFATAIIHLSYIGILLRRYQLLRQQLKDSGKNAGN
jgi:hypothetical protein